MNFKEINLNEATLNTLEKELKQVDWTFLMSDDSYWVTRGSQHRRKIREMIEELYNKGLKKQTNDLFWKYAKGQMYPHEPKSYGVEE